MRGILAIALLVWTTACGGTTPESGEAPRVSTPATGGTLVIATHQDIAGVNDLVSTVTSFSEAVVGQMFLDLFDEQDDFRQGPPTFEPRLAESYEFSDDRLVLTVHLRSDVLWSDGEPVTAEDVRWTWQAQTDPGVGWAYAQSKERIRDVEVVDPTTVRFRFDRAYAAQLQDANEGMILPKHVWGALPFDEWPEGEAWFQEHLVVNGPFLLSSWSPQEQIVLERNPLYYERDRPRFDRVVFRVIPDRSNHITQLLRGEVDFVPRVGVEDAERIEADPGSVLFPYWHRQYTYVVWNSANPLFSEADVRRALTQAIDRQTIIDTLREGYAKVSTSPIISSVWAFADLEPWPYDPGAARAAFASQGWSSGDDGVLERDGERFAFTLSTNAASKSWRDTAAMIQQQLRLVGIEMSIETMEFNTLVSRLQEHTFDCAIGSFTIDTALDLKYGFHTDSIDDGYNFSGLLEPACRRAHRAGQGPARTASRGADAARDPGDPAPRPTVHLPLGATTHRRDEQPAPGGTSQSCLDLPEPARMVDRGVTHYLIRRLLASALLLLLVVSLSFFVLRAAPGDPTARIDDPRIPAEYQETLRSLYGLDRPLVTQYVRLALGCRTRRLGGLFHSPEAGDHRPAGAHPSHPPTDRERPGDSVRPRPHPGSRRRHATRRAA